MELHTDSPLGAALERQVAAEPDRDFVVYPDRDLRWTYGEFDERVNQLAKGLLAIGIGKGDHVGIWARNVPDWLDLHVRHRQDRRGAGDGEHRLQGATSWTTW